MVGGIVFGIDNRFSGRRSILRPFVHNSSTKLRKLKKQKVNEDKDIS